MVGKFFRKSSFFKFANRSFISGISVLFFAFIFVVAAGCKVGLGESVDTAVPVVKIETPGASDVLCGDIEVSGTWSDDKGITSVTITKVEEISGKDPVLKLENLPASYNDDGTWKCVLFTNTSPRAAETGANPLADGKYLITVIAKDQVGHVSAEQTRSFEVDGTEPLLALSKPNSLDKKYPATYGRTIKITGTISDSHSVPLMEIKVFTEDGTPIELAKSTFEGFDTSETSVVIAKYFTESELKLIPQDSDDYKLYQNYVNIYGDNTSPNFNTEQKYYIQIALTDKSGNVSNKSYLKTNLTNNVKAATGLALDIVDIRQIIDGSYTKEITTENKEIVQKIVDGTYNIEENGSTKKYLADDKNMLVFSVNSKANPTYQFMNGYDYDDDGKSDSFNSIKKENGSLNIMVNSGLDGAAVYPNTIKGTIIKLEPDSTNKGILFDPRKNSSFEYNDGKLYKNGTDVTAEYIFEFDGTFITDKNGDSIESNTTAIDSYTYSIKLSDVKDKWKKDENDREGCLLSAHYYKIELTGLDENENELIEANDANFGFYVETSSSAAKSSFSNDGNYVNAAEFAKNGKIALRVTDDDNQSVIKATISALYFDSIEDSVGQDLFNQTAAKQVYSKELSGSMSYDLEADLNFGTNYYNSTDDADNYTIAILVTLEKSGAATSNNVYYVYADNKAPEISLTNPELKKLDDSGNIIITENYLTKAADGYTYTVNGIWSDKEGSGTNKVYYQFINDAGSDFKIAEDSKDWLPIDEEGAPTTLPKSENQVRLSSDFNLAHGEGKNKAIFFYATDAVGNKTPVQCYKNIVFDFSIPSITTMEEIPAYYNNSQKADITLVAEDSNELKGINVEIKKYDSEKTVYNVIKAEDYEKSGIQLSEFVPENGSKRGTVKISIKTDGSADGKYLINARSTDISNRESELLELKTIVDGTIPVLDNGLEVSGELVNDEKYFTMTGLSLGGKYIDETSELKTVYFFIDYSGRNAEVPENLSEKYDTSVSYFDKKNTFSMTTNMFRENKDGHANTVYIQAKDNAGNLSKIEKFKVNVDTTSPVVKASASDGSQVPTFFKKDSDAKIILTASDAISIKNLTAKIEKDGVEISKEKYEEYGILVSDFTLENDAKSGTVTITLKADGSENGKFDGLYSISAQAEDSATNLSSNLNVSTTIDTIPPAFVSDKFKINTKKWSENQDIFFDATSLSVDGEFIDSASKLKNVYYWVAYNGRNESVPQNLAETKDGAVSTFTNGTEFNFISNAFTEGTDGTSSILYIQADDVAGNLSERKAFPIKIDTTAPTITAETPALTYKKDALAKIKFTATDTNQIKEVIFTIKKNGTELSDYETNGIKILQDDFSADRKTLNATLSFDTTGLADGVYTIKAEAKDIADKLSVVSVNTQTTIDATAPEYVKDSLKVASANWQGGKVYNSTNLAISGSYTEKVSGLSCVYYFIDYTGRSAPTPTSLYEDGNHDGVVTASLDKFDFTSDLFKENKGEDENTIYLQAEDKAGNLSKVESWVIPVDLANPELTNTNLASYYKEGIPQVTFTAQDSNKVKKLDIKVYKNYTGSSSEALDSDELDLAGIKIEEPVFTLENDGENNNISKAVATVKFNTDGNHDGKFTVKAVAEDAAGRKSQEVSLTTTIDATKPVLDGTLIVNGNSIDQNSAYLKGGMQAVKGSFVEEASGMDCLYYWVDYPGRKDSDGNPETVPADISTKYDALIPFENDSKEFQIYIDKFEDTVIDSQGKATPNYLYIMAKDKAGNTTDQLSFEINVDSTEPVLTKPQAEPYYKEGSPAQIVFEAEDKIKIKGWNSFTVKKGTTEILTKDGSEGVTIVDSTSDDGKKLTRTITFVTDGSADGNYTISAQAIDAAGNKSGQQSIETVIDGTAPVLENTLKVGSSDYSTAYQTTNILKFSGSYTEKGSGMDTLYYYVLEPGVSDSNVPLDLSALGADGKPVCKGDISFKQNSTAFSFSLDDFMDNQNGACSKLYIQAKDAAGNLSERLLYNINIDTARPKFIIDDNSSLRTSYTKNESASITLKATDGNKVEKLDVNISKIVKNGTSESTVLLSKDEYAENGITLGDAISSGDGKEITRALSFTTDGTKDGKFEIEAVATDIANQSSEELKLSTTIDGTPPVFADNLFVGGEKWTTDSFYETTNLLINGGYIEETSGIKFVYYKLLKPNEAPLTGATAINSDYTKKLSAFDKENEFEFTERSFVQNKGSSANKLYIQAEDAAGNLSDVKEFAINVDSAAPEISIPEELKEITKKYYNSGAPELTFTATDSNELKEITVSIMKGSQTLSEDDYSKYGITVTKSQKLTTEDGSSAQNATVKFTADGVNNGTQIHDGVFTVRIEAKDALNRPAAPVIREIIIDATKPEFKGSLMGGTPKHEINENSYFKSGTLKAEGEFTEAIGLDAVYYWLQTPGSTVEIPKTDDKIDLTITRDDIGTVYPSNTSKFEITLDELKDTVSDGTNSTPNVLYVQAKDKAGNVSEVSQFKINVDSKEPVLNSSGIKEYYKKGDIAQITFTAEDLIKIGQWTTFDITKKVGTETTAITTINDSGVIETTANSGVTVADPAENDTNANTAKKLSKIITFTTDGTFDGEYTIIARVQDEAGNKSSEVIKTVFVDGTEPQFEEENSKLKISVGGDDNYNWQNGTYYKKDSLKVKGSGTDSGSGLDTLYYYVLSPKSNETVSEDYDLFSLKGKPGFDEVTIKDKDFNFTLSELEDNINKKGTELYVQLKDKAGNLTKVKKLSINVDNHDPELQTTGLDEYYKGNENASVTLTATDEDLITSIELKINDEPITITATDTAGQILNNGIKITPSALTQANSSGGKSTKKITILFSDSAAKDGKFTITAKANDNSGRNSTEAKLSTTIDRVVPVYIPGTLKVVNSIWNASSYYKDTTLKMSGLFTEATSGMDTLYYYVLPAGQTVPDALKDSALATTKLSELKDSQEKKLAGEVTFKTGSKDFSFTAEDYADNTSSSANTLYIQSEDKAGNVSAIKSFTVNVDTTAPDLSTMFYQIGEGSISKAGGIVYVNGTSSIKIYGNYKDEQSGVSELGNITLAGNPIAAGKINVTYSTSTINSKDDIEAISFSAIDSITNKKEIGSWKAEFTPEAGGKFALEGYNGTFVEGANGGKTSDSPFEITLDTTPPKLNNISLKRSDERAAYEKSGAYYINNKAKVSESSTEFKTFTFAGVSTDNIGVDSVKLEIFESETSTTPVHSETVKQSEWTFAGVDLHELSSSAIAKITVTDIAGNPYWKKMNLVFDTVAPKAMHWADAKNKDVYFRIGDSDSDVGGKYSYGTYGNDSTIEIRGTFEENGSGLRYVYYKIFDSAPTSDDISKLENGTLAADGNISVLAGEKLQERTVSYNKDAAGTTTGTKEITSNFRDKISGFNNTNNYLVLIAEDYVGNRAADTLDIYDGTNSSQSGKDWNSDKAYYSVNKDTTVPKIEATSERQQFTNGKKAINLTGTVSDEHAGVKSVQIYIDETVTVDGTNVQVKYPNVNSPSSNPQDAVKTNGSNWSDGWKAEIPADTFKNITSGSVTVYAIATDNAGSGNSKTISAATVTIDQKGPEITIGTIKNADSTSEKTMVNGVIDISVTATDDNGVEGPAGLYYKVVGNNDAAPTAPQTNADPTDDSFGWTQVSATSTGSTSWSFTGINTQKLDGTNKINDGSRVYFTAAFKDNAGNTGYSAPVEVVVDQNTDRPKVSFSNLELQSTGKDEQNNDIITAYMAKDTPVWLKNTTKIIGTISDDDGIDSVKISLTGDTSKESDWKTIRLSGSAFSYDLQDFFTTDKEISANGPKTVYFQIKDTGKTKDENGQIVTGTTFTSSTANSTKAVYISDGTCTYGGGNASSEDEITKAEADSILYVKPDTLYPEIILKGAKLSTAQDFTTSYASIKLGGSNTKFDVKFTAEDSNGIDESSLAGTADFIYTNAQKEQKTLQINSSEEAAKNVEDGKTVYLLSFELSTENLNELKGYAGSVNFRISGEDMAGNSSSQTASITYDFAPSVVTFNSPLSSTTLSGAVTAYGTLTENANVFYAVSTSPDILPGTSATVWYDEDGKSHEIASDKRKDVVEKTIDDASLSWTIYFDNGDETLPGTHDNSLNKFLIYYGIADKDSSSEAPDAIDKDFKTLVKLYLLVKTVDEAGNVEKDADGNIKYSVRELLVDPQGDKPSLAFSYPSTNNQTLGGRVSIYGTATDPDGQEGKIGVDSVWVQIKSTTHKNETFATDSDEYKNKYGSAPSYDAESGVQMELTKADLDYMAANGYDVYKMSSYIVNGTNSKWEAGTSELNEGESASEYAALANLSGAAWNLDINKTPQADGAKLYEFDPPSGENQQKTNGVAIRVIARDLEKKFSQKIDRFVSFDADNPVISNLFLVQSDDKKLATQPTASKAYTQDMFVKGDWYLTGTATDKDEIARLEIDGKILVEEGKVKDDYKDQVSISEDKTTVQFKYHLNTNVSEKAGELQFTVIATDKATPKANDGNESLCIKYDNKKPRIAAQDSAAFGIQQEICQNNSWYTFNSYVYEDAVDKVAQSGFAYTAFYFQRSYGSGDNAVNNIYDVLQSKDNAAISIDSAIPKLGEETATAENTIVTDEESGLYWYRKAIKTGSISGSTFELTDAADSLRGIRVNALINIKGVLYLIKEVNGNSVTVDGSTLPADATAAYVAIAGIIDNTTPEGSGTGAIQSDGYYESPSRDDGDRMIESVDKSGTEWKWEASICSRNISDGPVTLHYVVFDKAGNCTKDSFSGMVSNNRPRIAGAIVKTDYNGDGDTDDEGETFNNYAAVNSYANYYTGTITNGGAYIYDPDKTVVNKVSKNPLPVDETYGKADAPIAVLRGKTVIQPEIVGGNNKLYYEYKIGTGGTNKEGKNIQTPFISKGSTDYTAETGNIDVQLGDLLKFGDTTNPSTATPFEFKFWDSTEGTVSLKDATKQKPASSQNATLTMYFAIQAQKVGTPTVNIKPFYWKSLTENSIKDSSTAKSFENLKGHIELEGDLPADKFTAGATDKEMDRDPKVSGEIVVEGTAHDDKLINKIKANIFGTEQEVAAYSNGSLASSKVWADYSTNNYCFEITEQTVGSSGHDVEWKLYINTAKLGIAATDKAVTVTATNFGKPTASTENGTLTSIDGTTKYAATPSYKDAKSNTPGTVQTTNEKNTAYYKMDIVPYITGIETSLSSLKKNNPSVYARTALGHYSVRSNETVKLKGFNLDSNGRTEVTLDINSITTSSSYDHSVKVDGTTVKALNNYNGNNSKGEYEGTVNLTDSTKADYAPTGDKSTYQNFYNRQPNGDNNNLLTDDIWFDVWQFNSAAAVPISGKIEQPVMKIRPTDGKIGFAFVNGPLYFSMGGSQTVQDYSYQYWVASFDFFTSVGFTYDDLGNSWGVAAGGDINDSQSDAFTLMSSKFGIGGHDRYASYNGTNSLRLERIGQIMSSDTPYIRKVIQLDAAQRTGIWIKPVEGEETATIQDGDILYFCNEDGTLINNTAFRIFGKWPTDGSYSNNMLAFQITDTTNNVNQAPATASLGKTLDDYTRWNSGYENGDRDNSTNIEKDNLYVKIINRYQGFDKQRIQNPSLVTSTNGTNTNVYLAYYDALNDEIRFKSGTSTENGKKEFGQFKDSATEPMPNYDATNVSIIAGASAAYKNTGSYLNLGVIPASVTGNKDTVIAVWLDQTTNPALPTLYYAYNNDPITNPGNWTYVGRILPESSNYANAGEYCKVAVDSNGGVHIAAYDSKNLDLVYAYLPANKKGAASSVNDFVTCVVDSNGILGSNLTLDVGKVSADGNVIPYIGYYSTSSIKPKMAYYIDGFASDTTSITEGSNNDTFTGAWECVTIPTASTVEMQSNQHNDINIGLWKENGVIVDSTTSTKYTTGTDITVNQANGYGSTSYGQVYGNGSKNAVLGYAIKYGTSDHIETAQMK